MNKMAFRSRWICKSSKKAWRND